MKIHMILPIAIVWLCTTHFVSANDGRWNTNSTSDNISHIAISGYDTVAYFTDNQATKGKKQYSHSWDGVVWYFKNAKHRNLFKKNPEKYAPQYGGYCAYGTANQYAVKVDPTQFTVVNDKLYLNYNDQVNQRWSQKRTEYIRLADEYWPDVLADVLEE